MQFHTFDESPLPPSDTLIENALEFLKYGNYLQYIVDLLMKITADALHLNLFIYQNQGGNVQLLNFQNLNSNWIVCVKFTHSDEHPQGNHYDSIICTRPE